MWRFSLGTPETITPVSTRRYDPAADALGRLPRVDACPINPSGIASPRGFLVTLPLAPNEMVYGLGLQLQSFQQRGLKKNLRVNADPVIDSGDSHAPVPFYVTTRGYGVLVDTARYATFYVGNKSKKPATRTTSDDQNRLLQSSDVLVEIPIARGAEVYVFAGPTMRGAVQRYNLFSGGGPLPPRWGLGFWYRVERDFGQDEVLRMAAELRDRRMPIDVLGLEPHWQSHSYSGSFTWSKGFPEPGAMIEQLRQKHFRLNLWEHAFTHPSSPMYADLLPHAGDHEVWGGIVPDFLSPEGRQIFSDFHERELLALGVSGFKLDECDNSDFTGNWSFPEISQFPSGADGEQMHSLFGLRYQDTIQSSFDRRKLRTYGLVRSSGALAAPYPYVLYSDLYDHRRFIHGVAQGGFSGLLWTPEVRHARDKEDLIRRLQSVALSPLALINAWYLRNPPWKQVDRNANNAGQFDPNWEELEARCREIFELRMRLIPYLHGAFVRYHREGLPPFRALVMDYPDDAEVRSVSNEYLMGEDLLVAPVVAGESERSVYLPEGDWWDYWTGQRHAGRQRITIDVPLDRIPLFVKSGTILPVAHPTLHTDDDASGQLTAMVFGDGARSAVLFEDDGSADPSLTSERAGVQRDRMESQMTSRISRRNFLLSTGAAAFVSVASRRASRAAVEQQPDSFVHPGALHTQNDLDRMAAQVAAGAQPWIDSWNLLIANPHSSLSWRPRPVATVVRGGAGQNYPLLYNDIAAAYACALRWNISGDTAYADKAVEIMNAWSSTLTSITGTSDKFLAAGIYGYQFANVAEIMRMYDGWAATDFAQFQDMMLSIFYPMNHNFLVNHNGACISHYWCNWDACNMASIVSIGVLCDSSDIFNEAVDYYQNGAGNGSIWNAVYYVHPDGSGQWQESGRDQQHSMLGLGLLATVCGVAWNQGVDLYGYGDNRLLAGAEYIAKYNLGSDVPYLPYNNCDNVNQTIISAGGRGGIRPIWEQVYNHYVVSQGLDAPYTAAYAQVVRPEGGGGSYGPNSGGYDHLGYGTLTFTSCNA